MYALIIATAVISGPMSTMKMPAVSLDGPELAVTCFKKGEVVDGMNKICFYDCLGSDAAITIGATQLCPLTVNN